MNTTIVTIGKTYTQVVADSDAMWVIQNISGYNISAMYADTAPDDSIEGIILTPYDGLVAATHGTGNVWVKTTVTDTAEVVVTK